jgi:FMN-dependent NADH-azoreductase
MSRLLHVSSSPRGEASESLRIADAFLAAYRDSHPNDTIDHYDLWDGTLPEFGPAFARAKMAVIGGSEPTGDDAVAWHAVRRTFEHFDSYDRYLFSVPMWNHTVPYILKQYIDVITQPGMLFTLDPDAGYSGLLTGKKATVMYTGAVYRNHPDDAFGRELQADYFDYWLHWAGITDTTSISFLPNLATADPDSGRDVALASAREAGKTW